MNSHAEELKGGNAAAEWNNVKLPVTLSAQILESFFGYVRRRTEEGCSGAIEYWKRTGQASQTLW